MHLLVAVMRRRDVMRDNRVRAGGLAASVVTIAAGAVLARSSLLIGLALATLGCAAIVAISDWARRSKWRARMLATAGAAVAVALAATDPHRVVAWGEMPLAAITVVLSSFAETDGVAGWSAGQAVTVLLATFSITALVGGSYGAIGPGSSNAQISVPGSAALGGLSLATAMSLTRPDRGLVKLLTSSGPGGTVARRLMAAAMLFPLLLGWLKIAAVEQAQFDFRVGALLTAMAFSAGMVGLVWFTARSFERAEETRQRADLSLRASEERFRGLVESMDDLVFTLNADLHITGLFGRGAPELRSGVASFTGRHVVELFGDRHRDEVTSAAGAARSGRSQAVRLSDPGREAARSQLVWFSPMRAAGAVVGLVGVARDITEQRELEARVELASRMASIGRLAAGVGHEINNPLTYVLANLKYSRDALAARSIHPDATNVARDAVLDALDEASEGAERIGRIVRELATMSRADDEGLEPVDVLSALERALKMAQSELRHRAQLERHVASVSMVIGSESRLTQVFLNLLINAAQSMPAGSASRNRVSVALSQEDGFVVVTISDTGAGIPEDVIAHVFDPFFTTKRVGEGTGLGLAICQGIVTGMGGEIAVDSEPGKGSTFRVCLPAAPEGVTLRPAVAPRPQAARRAKILVIDDEPLVCSALQRLLSAHHHVTTATSARDALDRLTRGEHFDAILCDVMMPDMGGAGFHERIAEGHPELLERIIYMTGGAFSVDTQAFVERTANVKLAKPVDQDALQAALRSVLERVPSG